MQFDVNFSINEQKIPVNFKQFQTRTVGDSVGEKGTVLVQVIGQIGTQTLTTTHTHDQIVELLNAGKNVILECKAQEDSTAGHRYTVEYYNAYWVQFVNIFYGYNDGAYRLATSIIDTSKDISNWTISNMTIPPKDN